MALNLGNPMTGAGGFADPATVSRMGRRDLLPGTRLADPQIFVPPTEPGPRGGGEPPIKTAPTPPTKPTIADELIRGGAKPQTTIFADPGSVPTKPKPDEPPIKPAPSPSTPVSAPGAGTGPASRLAAGREKMKAFAEGKDIFTRGGAPVSGYRGDHPVGAKELGREDLRQPYYGPPGAPPAPPAPSSPVAAALGLPTPGINYRELMPMEGGGAGPTGGIDPGFWGPRAMIPPGVTSGGPVFRYMRGTAEDIARGRELMPDRRYPGASGGPRAFIPPGTRSGPVAGGDLRAMPVGAPRALPSGGLIGGGQPDLSALLQAIQANPALLSAVRY